VPRLAADKVGDALRRQPGLFGGAHDAAHLVTDLPGGAAFGLAQRRPLAKGTPALATLMPAAVARAVALFAAELARAVAAGAAVACPLVALAAERPLAGTAVAWAAVSLMDNNSDLTQFAFSLCIYPALNRCGLPSAPVSRRAWPLLSPFLLVLNIY